MPPSLWMFVAGVAVLVLAWWLATRQAPADPYVRADDLIRAPQSRFAGFDAALRTETARKRARIERLEARARRARAHMLVPAPPATQRPSADVVAIRDRRQA